MNVIDSSCWVAYFAGHPVSSSVEKYVKNMREVIVPSLVIYEVYRHLSKKISPSQALFYVTQLEKGTVVPLDGDLAITAAEVGLEHRLATADAIIYATALSRKGRVITLDNDFRSVPDCVVLS